MTTDEKMRSVAKKVKDELPANYGFALIVFEFNKPGISNYISNAQRSDMIKAMEETVKRLKENQDFQTPSGN